MTDPSTISAFRELIAHGLIVEQPAPRTLSRGNVDRMDTTRTSWLVSQPSGEMAKLTLGRDLSDLAARQAALAQACPTVTTAQLGYTRLSTGDALLEAFFDGTPLESAAGDRLLSPDIIRQTVTGVGAALAATEQTSNESARAAEWNTWTGQLLTLPVWSSADGACLRNILLPALYQQLAVGPATTRWTNGDFLPANILIKASGESRLIDAEFAARTHFFTEDAVRFRILSPGVQDHPDLFVGLLPEPGLCWHLYFWLRQFQLEVAHNTPAYLARVQSNRLGLIRRLAELGLGTPLPDWSVPAVPLEHRLEDFRRIPDDPKTAQISGWCHVPEGGRLRAIVAQGPSGRLATVSPTARPDVHQHFREEPSALSSGFSLSISPQPDHFPLTLCAMIDHGTLLPFLTLTLDDLPGDSLLWDDYPAWAACHDPDPAPPAVIRPPSSGSPLFSLLLPVYKTPEAYLTACIGSVRAQHYPNWELCIVDDGSGLPALTDTLNSLAADDPRIRVQARGSNGGISQATNDALAMARGEFVVLLDHDDLLRPHALTEFARWLNREPSLDVLYSDEDKITANGQRLIPFLKPDYSPEFLLGVMYIGHALCVRTSVARSTGGFDPAFDGIQDYEFFLRVTEKTRRIGHIPQMLYHWRQSPGSSALHGNVKGDMDQKQVMAVQSHLRRRGDRRIALTTGGHRVSLRDPRPPSMEIVQASDPALALPALRRAVGTSAAEVLVLLSVEPGRIQDGALAELAALAVLPDSGCVAPVLLSAEGRVYESGRVGPVPIMRGFHPKSDGYHGSLRCNREVDTVSPACIAVRRELVKDPAISEGDDWSGFCSGLRARGLYHRVCASARVQLDASFKDTVLPGIPAVSGREYYHPLFDAQKGDYTLVTRTAVQVLPDIPPRYYVDQPAQWDSLPRCLISRGWCFSSPSNPIDGIRLRVGDLTLTGVVGLSRPDVMAARPDAPGEFTGFEIRGTLPTGQHQAHLEVRLADGSWVLLTTRSIGVKPRVLPLWLGGGDWMELMFFQMPAHMAYPPRPLPSEKFPAAISGASHPGFSIVTPSYNQSRFLAETMRSVLEQDAAVDYVVQDGGSTDGSQEVIAQLERNYREAGGGWQVAGGQKTEDREQKSDPSHSSLLPSPGAPASKFRPPASGLRPPVRPRLLQWSSEPDSGQADAIVRAFARTSGKADDIMAWINSDDFYLPGALSYVADYFARHPEVDVLYGHRVVVNDESQEIGRWFLPRHDPEVLRLNDFVPQETLFWRRRIWDKAGGIDPSFKFALDWDLLLRFQTAGAKIVRVPYFLGCFRVHAEQKTSARMHDVGQREITLLRERTQGRPFPPQELEQNSRLLSYLRRSALIEWLWKLGLRAP